MLILLAGLQAIPADLYEAAKMDAARPVRVFFRITLPLVMPTFTVVIVLALIRSFQVFDEVWLLTGGGPGRETFMIVQNIFEVAFTGDRPEYGRVQTYSATVKQIFGDPGRFARTLCEVRSLDKGSFFRGMITFETDSMDTIQTGDRFVLSSTVRAQSGQDIPGVFGRAKWLRRMGVTGELFCLSGSYIRLGHSSSWMTMHPRS